MKSTLFGILIVLALAFTKPVDAADGRGRPSQGHGGWSVNLGFGGYAPSYYDYGYPVAAPYAYPAYPAPSRYYGAYTYPVAPYYPRPYPRVVAPQVYYYWDQYRGVYVAYYR